LPPWPFAQQSPQGGPPPRVDGRKIRRASVRPRAKARHGSCQSSSHFFLLHFAAVSAIAQPSPYKSSAERVSGKADLNCRCELSSPSRIFGAWPLPSRLLRHLQWALAGLYHPAFRVAAFPQATDFGRTREDLRVHSPASAGLKPWPRSSNTSFMHRPKRIPLRGGQRRAACIAYHVRRWRQRCAVFGLCKPIGRGVFKPAPASTQSEVEVCASACADVGKTGSTGTASNVTPAGVKRRKGPCPPLAPPVARIRKGVTISTY